ncbi:MAG: hypothetical protein JWQ74_1866 [Marmoricola sp.]|nr:hypothetical protein [Marmoricola sp.]
MSARSLVRDRADELYARLTSLEDLLLTRRFSLYGVAFSRVLAALTYVGILVTNFGHRQILFGAASDWVRPYRESFPQAPWVGVFENLSATAFTFVYLLVIVVGVAFLLGWHARLTGPALLFGAYQIIEMNPVVHDQGDNILRIGFFFLLLTDNAAVWSLDARRRARREQSGEGVRGILGGVAGRVDSWNSSGRLSTAKTLLHNGAVFALSAQLVIIYIAAGMFKVSGNGWKFGTAISYPLRLDEYQVWPFLNDFVVASAVGVWFMTYAAVFLQLYFPVLLINRVTRRIALVAVVGLHVSIAILMGLPWFTLAMVAFDGIFVSTATYQALEGWFVPQVTNLRQNLARRLVRSS